LKVHLFDIDIPGKFSFKESSALSAGDEATVVETGSLKESYSTIFEI
jgi:predicted amidohydrolase